jgi:FkbM family methyltransferase
MGPIKSAIWMWIHRHRRNRAVGRFVRLCKNIHRASENPGYEVESNGERDVLQRAVVREAPVLFDVGANVGDWSAMALSVFPKAQIHAFELNPALTGSLEKRFANAPSVRIHPTGLSASSGTVDFFSYAGDASVLSSLRVALHNHAAHEIKQGQVRMGDEVCRELNISRIDFLKIDVEGAEFEVLAGFHRMFAEKRISAIQFEHQGGRFLRDFYDFFAPRAFAVGKLYANYVDFREHSAELEHFLGPNYIAVPSSQSELIASLQRGW